MINDIIYFENILGLRFYEDWDISNNSFSFKKNVKGIVCLIGDYNENGVLIGLKKIPVYIEFLK